MKVGVTGGAGFIGSWVCHELERRGHTPVIFDHLGRTQNERICMVGSVRDETAVMELAAHVDGIIHLAAVLGTQETIRNPRPAFETNMLGGLNVLEACDLYQIPLVNIAVGNFFMDNSYSLSKNAFERTVNMYVTEHGIAAANVRVMNAYGPRQTAAKPFASAIVRKVMPAFICRALSNIPIETYGDGNQISDVVFVGDVAHALVEALERAPLDTTIEVGPAISATVNDVALAVIDECRKYTGESVGLVRLPMRPGETPGATVSADTSTLAKVGMDAADFVGLEEGIARTVEWFVANEGVTWRKP